MGNEGKKVCKVKENKRKDCEMWRGEVEEVMGNEARRSEKNEGTRSKEKCMERRRG